LNRGTCHSCSINKSSCLYPSVNLCYCLTFPWFMLPRNQTFRIV